MTASAARVDGTRRVSEAAPSRARGVLDRNDVAAEVARDREGALGRLGERVRVLDGEGEACAVALRPPGDRAGSRLLPGAVVGRRAGKGRARRLRRADAALRVDGGGWPGRLLHGGSGRVMPIATAETTASAAAAGRRAATPAPRDASRDGDMTGGVDARVSTWRRSASPAVGRVARSSSTIWLTVSFVHPLLESLQGRGSAASRLPWG